MAYSKAKIDETGLHIPTYIEIRDDLLQKYREIFGDDVYLENDSQDYEMISLFADKLYDAYEALHQAYNSRSPRTSIGSALDAVVAINGLRRKKASYSTCTLRLRGTKGTVIYNGSASDDKGARFMLPPEVEIPESGTIDVLATCNRTGPTTAAKDTVYNIDTPTRGWVSVTNPEPALAGEAVETDATLRSRQAISTAKPSNTVLEGTVGGIAEISGVTRYRVYENDTSAPDENGIPGHTISAVVEGGSDTAVAQAIYLRKTPGTGTYGDQAVTVASTVTGANPIDIKFWRPEYVDIQVYIKIKPLQGYTNLTPQEISESVTAYINSFGIGDDLPISWLWPAAFSGSANAGNIPVFSIVDLQASALGEPLDHLDIITAYNQVVRADVSDVTVEEVSA